jgi:hypothetical protein
MKKLVIILIIFAIVFVGCKNRSSSSINLSNSYVNEDTAKVYKDTLIDKRFHDFIYEFACDKEFQLVRSMVESDIPEIYGCIIGYDYAEYIFNSFNIPDKEFEIDLRDENYLSIMKPTENKKTTLSFKKIDGQWFLSDIEDFEFDFANTANFEAFLYQFSIDSVFRKEHIKFPLKYEHIDYDGENEIITDYLTEENVFKYNFFNERYFMFFHGAKISNEDNILIFLTGIGYGLHSEYYFEKFNNAWKLIEHNDFSM